MRDWINLFENINEEDAALVEERLDERSMFRLDLKNDELLVMQNPRRRAIVAQITDQNRGWFRGFLLEDGNVLVFDAWKATHHDVGSALGIYGTSKRFELRGPNRARGDQLASMLYVARHEASNPEWRENPMVARMFATPDFIIGSLRS